MKIMKKYTLWLAAPLLCILMLASCKKNNEVGTLQPSRAFVPTTIVTTPTGASVKIDWKASLFSGGTGIKYTVDISKTAAFSTIDYTTVTDAVTLTLTDAQLAVGQPYYVRIKANATETTPGSNAYVVTASSFTMPGILLTVPNADLTGKTVILRWLSAPDVTRIVITPTLPAGTPVEVALTPADVAAGFKLIGNLTGDVSYRADIYAGTRVKGFTTFKTPLFSRIISNTDNLIDVINNAANNDVIGLSDGVYEAKDATAAYANIVVLQKNITLQSTSGDPKKVKINYKQIDLKGTGAGIALRGIEFDNPSAAVTYFINLTGVLTDAEAATFNNISIDNCIIRKANATVIRANRNSTVGAYKINNVSINNSVVYESGTSTFNTLTLDRAQFARLDITNSTFYDFGRCLVSAATALPAGTPVPVINIVNNTFNYFGGSGMNILVDAGSSTGAQVSINVQNNIIANTPRTGATASGLIRAAATGSTIAFTNNNVFNIFNGAPAPAELPLPAGEANAKRVNLGWTVTQSDFTLPAGSELRTGGTTGGPIGDPRWAK